MRSFTLGTILIMARRVIQFIPTSTFSGSKARRRYKGGGGGGGRTSLRGGGSSFADLNASLDEALKKGTELLEQRKKLAIQPPAQPALAPTPQIVFPKLPALPKPPTPPPPATEYRDEVLQSVRHDQRRRMGFRRGLRRSIFAAETGGFNQAGEKSLLG